MKYTLFILLLASISSFAFADEFPDSVQIVGGGIQNKQTEEQFLLACTSEPTQEMNGMSCRQMRFVRHQKNTKPSWVGEAFSAKTIYSISSDLKDIYHTAFGFDFFRLYVNKSTSALTQQNGWNWAERPLQLDDPEYTRVLMASLAYAYRVKGEDANRASENATITTGDAVFVADSLDQTYRVEKTLKNNEYQLSDGHVVKESQLSRSLDSNQKVQLGSQVYCTKFSTGSEEISLFKVDAISDNGSVQLKYLDGEFKGRSTVREMAQLRFVAPVDAPKEKVFYSPDGGKHYQPYFVIGQRTDTEEFLALTEDGDRFALFFIPKNMVSRPIPQMNAFKVSQWVHQKSIKNPGYYDQFQIQYLLQIEGRAFAFVFNPLQVEHQIGDRGLSVNGLIPLENLVINPDQSTPHE